MLPYNLDIFKNYFTSRNSQLNPTIVSVHNKSINTQSRVSDPYKSTNEILKVMRSSSQERNLGYSARKETTNYTWKKK